MKSDKVFAFVACFLASACAVLMLAIGINVLGNGSEPVDPGCYIVTDNAGGVHRLVEPPQFDIRVGAVLTEDGDWLFPSVVEVDEQCLSVE